MFHGDKDLIKRIEPFLSQDKVNIIIRGHTHLFEAYHYENIVYMNPGSPSLPRAANPPSIGLIDLEAALIRIIHTEDSKILLETNLPKL